MALNTERCDEIVARDAAVISTCCHLSYFPLAVKSAEGAIVTDEDGNQFIDFLSAASTLNTGSREPSVMAAALEQIEAYPQYILSYTYNRKAVEYAERLVSVFPGRGPAKVLFSLCGSDANDAAVKFCRAYTGRQNVILFLGAYHGCTYGSIAMSSCSQRMHAKIGPFMPGFCFFPYFSSDVPDEVAERESVAAIEAAFETYLPADECAGAIVEPILGDSGMLPAHPIFMRKLRELCDRHGILLISEEVQQAFWRTGKMFCIEHYGIEPDGVIMGKSLGAGFPLGAFMARAEIMDSLRAPAHGFSLGGSATACAAGIAAFDLYRTEAFQARLASNIELIARLCDDLQSRWPNTVGGWNGIGMSIGITILKDGAPDEDGVFKIMFRSYERGLLMITLAGCVLRVQPPLNIEPELLERGFDIIAQAIEDYERGAIPDDVLRYRAGW